MVLSRITLRNLRNHRYSSFECPEGVVLFIGENGAGKTTILEGISLLCSTRSFVTKQERSIVGKEGDRFMVEGEFVAAGGTRHSVSLVYPGEQNSRDIFIDHSPLESAADLIGRFPMVALSPQHRPITAGGPSERRAFMDFMISQVHHSYLMDLIEYRRILRQRNILLQDERRSRQELQSLLEPWNHSLAPVAIRIVRRRHEFVEEFAPFLERTMAEVIDDRERVSVRYGTAHAEDLVHADAATRFVNVLEQRFEADVKRRSTTVGPHRDELEIYLNDLEARAQASQGQHKTVLIALKVAEYHYLRMYLDEDPLLLLDDVFSELDDERLARILGMVSSLGQTFITTANQATLQYFPQADPMNMSFRINAGAVTQLAEVA